MVFDRNYPTMMGYHGTLPVDGDSTVQRPVTMADEIAVYSPIFEALAAKLGVPADLPPYQWPIADDDEGHVCDSACGTS